MNDYRDRAKRLHDAIHEILIKEWDPIGVSDVAEAQNEYDSYVPWIYRRLISREINRKLEAEIFDYLWYIETVHMTLRGNRRHTKNIAKKLCQLIS